MQRRPRRAATAATGQVERWEADGCVAVLLPALSGYCDLRMLYVFSENFMVIRSSDRGGTSFSIELPLLNFHGGDSFKLIAEVKFSVGLPIRNVRVHSLVEQMCNCLVFLSDIAHDS